MFQLATAAQMKELDRRAIQERGISSLTLMENAARAVADMVWEELHPDEPEYIGHAQNAVFVVKRGDPPTDEEQRQMDEIREIIESKNIDPTPRVAVFCGPGNNGGDGIAAARLLLEMGVQVRTFFVGDRAKMTPDERSMEEKLIASGGVLEDFTIDMTSRETLQNTLTFEGQKMVTWLSTCDCKVDALFGIGLARPVEGIFSTAVRLMSGQSCPVVACDIPSGVHADTGEVLGQAVQAKVTVTFTAPKPGLYLGEGAVCAGEVRVVDIGIPYDLEQDLFRALPRLEVLLEAGPCLPCRPRTAHKGDFGKVFILAGSEGYTGAAVLCANAAVRSGAGLVFLGVPREIYPIVAGKCLEAMPFPLPENYEEILDKARGCDVALLGPGLGRLAGVRELVLRLLADLEVPVVLDADGLNALAGGLEVLDARTAPTILTPHDGEFRRLSGCELPIRDRLGAARDFAQKHRCTLILKGHNTITAAPDGGAFLNATGNPGMAKGGSGDVLAGMIASFLGQKQFTDGMTERAALAVRLHGMAGDRCAREKGEYAMTPGDMLQALPAVLRELETDS